MSALAVFGYGSLASPASASLSLGRAVEPAGLARLEGWQRRWTTFRNNLEAEKTFALADGAMPSFVVGLNIERVAACEGANGALIEITEAEAERLDLREIRYDRIDVTADVRALTEGEPLADFERVVVYAAKARQHAPQAPAGAIVIAEYVRTVESAFAELGAGQLERYHRTTDPTPLTPVEATLVGDLIPEGNPRGW